MHRPSSEQQLMEFVSCVRRERLLRIIRMSSASLVVLSSPPGWGKSVLGYQAANDGPTRVDWVRCDGTPPPDDVLRSVLARASQPISSVSDSPVLPPPATPTPYPSCVVIDGVTHARRGWLLGLARAVRERSTGVRVLVTGEFQGAESESADEALVITAEDLALDVGEAISAASIESEADSREVRRVLRATGGHVGLFRLYWTAEAATSDCAVGAHAASSFTHAIRRRVEQLVTDESRLRVIQAAALLLHGSTHELDDLMGPRSSVVLAELSTRFPPVLLTSNAGDGREFVVHGGVYQWLAGSTPALPTATLAGCADLLVRRGESRRAARVLTEWHVSEVSRQWVEKWARHLIDSGESGALCMVLGKMKIKELMDRPEILVVWSRALNDQKQYRAALEKARAAIALAAGGTCEIEIGARTAAVDSLLALDDKSAALGEVRQLRLVVNGRSDLDAQLIARAYMACTRVAVHVGEFAEARALVFETERALGSSSSDPGTGAKAHMQAAMVGALAGGDFSSLARALSVNMARVGSSVEATMWRGNLSAALLDCGRTSRARQLLSTVDDASDGPSGALCAAIHAATGDDGRALGYLARSMSAHIDEGHESELAVFRVLASAVYRALGEQEMALSCAERAFERLAITNHLGYRRLATIEVAANLLALGDMAAARRWLEPLVSTGFDGNEYHALRADLVLAVCDCREGCRQSAVDRVAAHADHILTESSNWQLAMYIRAFPELIGVLAAAIGAAAIPIHLIRMVPAEYAERGLSACIGWLDPDEWRSLASRTLGDEEFVRFERMGGRPLCHVRMLGGLEVTIGERVIRERDWRKSKARLLFAMLASHRGADIPRDQILDALWPHMDEERARSNFYVAWSTMKSTLSEGLEGAGCPYVESIRGRCHILMDSVRLDLDDFEHAVNALRNAEEECDAAGVVDALHLLSNVYRGDLLPGDVYQDWFAPLRDSLRHRFIEAMSRGAEALLELDDPCEALVYARRALQADPLREDIYQLTLRAHIAAGQRSAAIETFLQCRSQLSEELGLDPSTDTMALYDEILAMEECPRRDSLGFRDRAASDAASV